MYLSLIFLENHANTNRYDVPMAINTDECGDDMATCGEKLLSSGCVRDALNLTIAKIANVKTKDVLTIGLTIADNENNGNVDSSTRRQRRLYYDDLHLFVRRSRRSTKSFPAAAAAAAQRTVLLHLVEEEESRNVAVYVVVVVMMVVDVVDQAEILLIP